MPGRPLWSGAISFGLVTLPCKLEQAVESHSVSFRQIHVEDGGRIRYRKVCELDGEELTEADIGKGYEIAKDQVIPITDQDLAEMPLPTAKAIEIVSFVPWESIDPRHIGESSYYVTADGQVAAKPYTLLRQALGRNEKVAVAKFALRGRERLGLLRPYGDALLLHAMRWDDEVRDPGELAPDEVKLTDKELAEAMALLEALSVDRLDELELTDQYRDTLVEVIEAKAEHRAPSAPEGTEGAPAGQVMDLMAALEESVAKAKASRGETSDGGRHATVHEMPKPKKAAAKKAPAKKTAAKKTAAKKAAPSRRRKSA
ncbi:Ku protein [Streptomyces sp. NPDC048350]|uniref:non-homologous end joining protein Ku n=1 Tax=Streptomyces sp. NPDC048350 TaxID=3365538 RepID=UPI0037123336